MVVIFAASNAETMLPCLCLFGAQAGAHCEIAIRPCGLWRGMHSGQGLHVFITFFCLLPFGSKWLVLLVFCNIIYHQNIIFPKFLKLALVRYCWFLFHPNACNPKFLCSMLAKRISFRPVFPPGSSPPPISSRLFWFLWGGTFRMRIAT